MNAKRDALRRYPALGFLGIAALLAVLLPSALNLPNSGPPTLAEYAPVPGQGDSQNGNLDRLGSGSNGDLGTGGGSGDGGDPGDLAQPRSSLKHCVGDPPRQTEDPLSPPCVAFFDGENGGATTGGVTKDEIIIVIHKGTSTTPRFTDLDDPNARDSTGNAQEDAFNDVLRAFAKYFNARYQTYGRHVRFWAYQGRATAAELSSDIVDLHTKAPFAVIPTGINNVSATGLAIARAKMFAITNGAFRRAEQQQAAPYLLSYTPDLEDEAAITGAYVCNKLAGRRARFSGNPADVNKTRTFGVVFQKDSNDPAYEELTQLFKTDVAKRCNLKDLPEGAARTSNDGQGDYALNMAAMSSAGVTTVVAFGRSTGPSYWSASSQGYNPEFIVPGRNTTTGPDENEQGRTYAPAFWQNAFGLTFDRLRGRREQQQWFAAYQEGCPGCPIPADTRVPKIYDQLTLMFWGIQAAGPRLTPANLDKGLHAIPPRASKDPQIPAAYFSANNYSWVKDAFAIRWSHTASDPNGRAGCFLLVRGGARFRADEWPRGDNDLAEAGPACHGSSR